tara:strand:- start:103355 stop:104353 length:999 start_codon:yes stop_codon:yes gene_type:complete
LEVKDNQSNHLSINDIQGIKTGHYTDLDAITGCTAIICEAGAIGGVDVRGGAPGSRETDLLDPTASVPFIHGVVLSGGSAFGLQSADGAMQYLENRDVGHKAGNSKIPIIASSILFDLNIGLDKSPVAESGYKACVSANNKKLQEGTIGAGTGATVAKLMGMERSIKGGIGSYGITLGDGSMVSAIVATNAIGGIFDYKTGSLIAGPLDQNGSNMLNPLQCILDTNWAPPNKAQANTTIGVVATDVTLTKSQAQKLSAAAHDGLALSVRPSHTSHDGDTFFCLSTGTSEISPDMDRLIAAASVCVAESVLRSVKLATSIGGINSINDLSKIN